MEPWPFGEIVDSKTGAENIQDKPRACSQVVLESKDGLKKTNTQTNPYIDRNL